MFRLTNQQYLIDRTWLADIWQQDLAAWAKLSSADQRALHDFFDPSLERSPDQALTYRRGITARDPSLPQRAGRALRRFERVAIGELECVPPLYVAAPRGRQKRHAISVRSVIEPHPDAHRFARLLLDVYRTNAPVTTTTHSVDAAALQPPAGLSVLSRRRRRSGRRDV